MQTQTNEERPTVLIVDDEEALLKAHARALEHAGYTVQMALNGASAVAALAKGAFDVILSDLDMPGMNGIRLLEKVREKDLDVPVVMITGAPTMDSAIAAMEHGALRYLLKPIDLPELVKVTHDAVRLHRLAVAKRRALDMAGGADRMVGDQAGLVASLTRAIESLHFAYQPIVSWPSKSIFAYEALLRSEERTLPHPGAILEAAERLGWLDNLGRRIRQKVTEPLPRLEQNVSLFVNLHPNDLLDEQLYSDDAPLNRVAGRVVLEITERASLHTVPDVQARVAKLKSRGFHIAIDDLGAGYAGLTSFSFLQPDIVKLDMDLVRGLHNDPTKLTLVKTMISMCKELGILVTAEGIEHPEERDVLAQAGCDLMQGYLFARPAPPFSGAKF